MSTTSHRKILALVVSGLVVASGLAIAGVAVGQMTTGNDAVEPDRQDTSYLRAVHVSPDAPAIDVAIDNETVLEGVQFGNVSDYLTVESGPHNVTITAADDPETVVFDDSVTVDQRSITSLVATGETSENASQAFEPMAWTADPWTPSENDSVLQVAHLSPDAPTVDVTAGNGSVVLADNLSYGNTSDYTTVPAGNYTVEIRQANETNDGPVVTTANVSLANESAYTAYAVGYLSPEDAPADTAFEVVPAEDATVTVQLPGANETEEPADPAEPAEPGEPGEPAEPAEPVEPGEPGDENETEEPVEPAEPVDENETEEPAEPAEPAEPGEPGEPAEPAEPAEPGEPVDETETEEPLDDEATTPTDEEGPGDLFEDDTDEPAAEDNLVDIYGDNETENETDSAEP